MDCIATSLSKRGIHSLFSHPGCPKQAFKVDLRPTLSKERSMIYASTNTEFCWTMLSIVALQSSVHSRRPPSSQIIAQPKQARGHAAIGPCGLPKPGPEGAALDRDYHLSSASRLAPPSRLIVGLMYTESQPTKADRQGEDPSTQRSERHDTCLSLWGQCSCATLASRLR